MTALYTSRAFYQRLMKMEFGSPEEMKSRLVSEQKRWVCQLGMGKTKKFLIQNK
jgi:hypothetical protein